LQVRPTFQGSLDGGGQLLEFQSLPIQTFEPAVPLDIGDSLALVSQSFSRKLLAEMPHQMLGGFGYSRWHVDNVDATEDLLIDLDLINAPEGGFTH